MTRKHLYEAGTTLLTRNLALLRAQGLGPEAGKGIRVQEGADCRGPRDGRDPARHGEDQYPIPLERGGGIDTVMPAD